jgi:histone deacetylase HOS3
MLKREEEPEVLIGLITATTVDSKLATQSSSKPAIFIQDACYQHKWIRTPDASHIFERPQRIRAVKLGLAAAIARVEESRRSQQGVSGSAKSPCCQVCPW